MSRQFFRSSFLAAVMVLIAVAGWGAGNPAPGEREPIVITAERMKATKLGDRVTFLGNVELKKEDMILTSDAIVVFYNNRTKGVNEIEARGNVQVRREGRVAFANRALYYSREEKIVLTGDARIIENKNQIGGDRITVFVRDDRSIVEGGRVLFYQDKAEESEKAEEGASVDTKNSE